MIKLGSIVKDTATGLKGMVTHLRIEMGGERFFLFQPRGLNPDNGQPVKSIWCVPSRLSGGEIIAEPELPTDVFGTEVEDNASGFKGIATGIIQHINGCVHIDVQPKGALGKTGAPVGSYDFDIRRLSGKAIKAMSDAEREQSHKDRPSPAPMPTSSPRMPR